MGNKRNKKKLTNLSEVTTTRNKFMCFGCLDGELDLNEFEMFQHKELEVALCDSCYDTHGAERWHVAGDWLLRDDGNKCQFCQICGEGGTLLPCDSCSLSYCTSCLGFWMGKEALDEVLNDDTITFDCFICMKDKDIDMCDKKFPNYKSFREATTKYGKYQAVIRGKTIEEDIKADLKSVKKIKKFKCFCCFELKTFTRNDKLKLHSKFNTVTCDECHVQLNQDDWTYTNDGKSDYCVVTGTDKGGDIFACDTPGCENVFCQAVLNNWLTFKEYEILTNDDDAQFFCFICNPDQGHYKKFLKETQSYLNAFDGEEFKLGEQSERNLRREQEIRKKKQEAKKIETEKSSSKRKRRSSSKMPVEEEEFDSEEGVSAPKTRNVSINFTQQDSDMESDPETDYLKPNGEQAEVPTEKEAKNYLVDRIKSGAFSKKYHQTKAYKKILKFAKNM